MKKNTLKSILFYCFTLFALLINAQTAPDEDANPDLSCPASGEFENNNTRNVDIPNSVNVGTVDDRTCYADYSESEVNGKKWGVYNITDGSNHWDAPNTLQPRIERSLSRSAESGVGSFARFEGVFRILEVGDAGSFGQDGTYIAQAKGKHTGGGGPPDPAICLYRAHPVYGTGANANTQVSFDIYAERILERGGAGPGREVVFLKNVAKNAETSFELEVGFRMEETIFGNTKVHYCDAVIGGDTFKWNIPSPERGIESGIRYGAYRVKGGRGQVRWANTTYQKEEVVDDGSNNNENLENYVRLRNLATGKYLMSDGATIVPSDSGVGEDKEWRFVEVDTEESSTYYNIDSKVRGIIRFKGGFAAPELISTNFSPPRADSDKMWRVYHNGDGSYSFETLDRGSFLYHLVDENNDIITHIPYREAGSKWVFERTTLSIDDKGLKTTSIKIYPNPTDDKFTIAFQNIDNIGRVEIYDILGKPVYQKVPKSSALVVDSTGFRTGVYLVKAFTVDQRVFYSKLIVN